MVDIYTTDIYAQLNPTWHEGDASWKAGHIEQIIRKNDLKFETVCEIGCGTGGILLNLSRAFPTSKFTGYDISPSAIERAKLKEDSRTIFHLANPLDDPKFSSDIVIIADVMEHVEDYITFLKAARRRGRYKIFHIPLDLSVQSLLRRWPIMNLRKQVGHIHYFFKDSALATLEDCGYAITDYTFTASRLELPNQALSSRLMRLPRS